MHDDREAAQPKLVLVVDDHEDVRDAVCSLLREEGYDTEDAQQGAEALDAVFQKRPDVIVMDLMMPVMNGWELWDILQADPSLKTIPVIVITASDVHLEMFGGVPVIRKPFDVDKLLAEVARALGQTA